MIEWITLPGLTNYRQALDLMEDKLAAIINNTAPETIFLLEHKPVYTAGTSFKPEELLYTNDIPVVYTGRGGKFTYHGPGQRVIYPLLNLSKPTRRKDIKLYVQTLEQWLINSLATIGVKTYTVKDRIGIWVNDRGQEAKIAALGLRLKKWVTYHGVAINIKTDLEKFSGIISCGLAGFPVTSLAKLGINISMEELDPILKTEFSKLFS